MSWRTFTPKTTWKHSSSCATKMTLRNWMLNLWKNTDWVRLYSIDLQTVRSVWLQQSWSCLVFYVSESWNRSGRFSVPCLWYNKTHFHLILLRRSSASCSFILSLQWGYERHSDLGPNKHETIMSLQLISLSLHCGKSVLWCELATHQYSMPSCWLGVISPQT